MRVETLVPHGYANVGRTPLELLIIFGQQGERIHLVVEDDRSLADALRRGLAEHGYAVDVADDGEEALPRRKLGDTTEPPGLEELSDLAEAWRPYRTWVCLLLRTELEEDTHVITSGSPAFAAFRHIATTPAGCV